MLNDTNRMDKLDTPKTKRYNSIKRKGEKYTMGRFENWCTYISLFSQCWKWCSKVNHSFVVPSIQIIWIQVYVSNVFIVFRDGRGGLFSVRRGRLSFSLERGRPRAKTIEARWAKLHGDRQLSSRLVINYLQKICICWLGPVPVP